MLTARLKIGSGATTDTRNYGFVYLSSDNVVGAPIKDYEETSYPEQEGVNVSPKVVDASFDYKVTFFIQADSLVSANTKIASFNNLLFTRQQGSDVKIANKVEFYNDYKRHKIVGYPLPISEAKDFWRDRRSQVNDVVIIEWTIKVTKPSECDFSL